MVRSIGVVTVVVLTVGIRAVIVVTVGLTVGGGEGGGVVGGCGETAVVPFAAATEDGAEDADPEEGAEGDEYDGLEEDRNAVSNRVLNARMGWKQFLR